MDSRLVRDNVNSIKYERNLVLILSVMDTGLKDDFKFETAMRLLPLSAQASVLRKKFQEDKIKTLCNRLLQMFGCLLISGLEYKNELKFKRGKFGKPKLDCPAVNVSFSMSNGEDHVCMYVQKNGCANSEVPVELGIDIASVKDLQKIEELELYRDIFTDLEYETLLNHPKDGIHKLFAHYWSLKESYTKYLGTGLNIDLKQVDTGPIKIDQPETVRDIYSKSIKFQSFWVSPEKEEIISVCQDNDISNDIPTVYNVSLNEILEYLEGHS